MGGQTYSRGFKVKAPNQAHTCTDVVLVGSPAAGHPCPEVQCEGLLSGFCNWLKDTLTVRACNAATLHWSKTERTHPRARGTETRRESASQTSLAAGCPASTRPSPCDPDTDWVPGRARLSHREREGIPITSSFIGRSSKVGSTLSLLQRYHPHHARYHPMPC